MDRILTSIRERGEFKDSNINSIKVHYWTMLLIWISAREGGLLSWLAQRVWECVEKRRDEDGEGVGKWGWIYINGQSGQGPLRMRFSRAALAFAADLREGVAAAEKIFSDSKGSGGVLWVVADSNQTTRTFWTDREGPQLGGGNINGTNGGWGKREKKKKRSRCMQAGDWVFYETWNIIVISVPPRKILT